MAASVDHRHFRRLDINPPPPSTTTTTTTTPLAFANNGFHPTSNDGYSSSSDDDDDDDPNWWKPLCTSPLEVEPPALDSRDAATSDAWIPRHPSLIRLTGRHPFNSEPPLSRLMHHGFITPTPLHYVRNHGPVPKASWSSWSLTISGLVRRPATLTMDDLSSSFPIADFPVTLVCAGNRRKEQNLTRQTIGFNWGPAAISTSAWRGVRLHDLLRRCGIMSRRDGALYVCFEGAEDLPGGGGSKYGTSLRREVAMDPGRDVLVAYMQNGELLAPDHGFPVRIIIPGFIGGRMVKWLTRIVVTSGESESYYHYRDNRVLPSHVDAELANAEAWWYKPEYIINELNINSVITTPGHDDILPINSVTTQMPYTLKGYAYSGGGKKVTRVEVTLDGGETWLVSTIDCPEKPNKYGKYWCWCFWSLDVEVLDLLGAKEIAVRAWDESLNTQPEKLIWNVMGMMNNCWFRVRVNVCRPHRGEVGLVFEHPTQPGNQPGGWMAKQKYSDSQSQPSLKKSLSSPFMNTSAASKHYSLSEVRRHTTSDSAWIIVNGHVYDCTAFLKDHPGGADSILVNAGTDCTGEFDAIHSDRAKSMLDNYRIGEFVTTGYVSDASVHGANTLAPIIESSGLVALRGPREKVPVRLIGKTVVSHDVRRFRFELPSTDAPLGLPVGKHIFLCASIDGKLCMRAYTPTSAADEVGHIDLLIKVYFKGVNSRFPNGGVMSQYLEGLSIGATLDIKGPVGHIEYAGRGTFLVNGKSKSARRLAMVAGGTGITPVYQVMQAVLRDEDDVTEMSVVYASRTEDDVLLREELEGWVREHPGRLKVWYVVGEARRPAEWEYSVGVVNEGLMREHLPAGGDGETLALACGPPPMIQFAVVPGFEKLGYPSDEVLVF